MPLQPNLPCVDNMAFDMDRMSRSQTSSQRTALVDLSSETSISLEPLRHSSSSQLPSEEELIPRSGEINIAVTSKSKAYSVLISHFWMFFKGEVCHFCITNLNFKNNGCFRTDLWNIRKLGYYFSIVTVKKVIHFPFKYLSVTFISSPPSHVVLHFLPSGGVIFPSFSALTASLHLLLSLSSVMSAGVSAPPQRVLPFHCNTSFVLDFSRHCVFAIALCGLSYHL